MAVRSTSSSAPNSAASASGASLIPQGAHLGKPPIPLTRSFTLVGARNRAHLHLVSPSISKNHTAIISSDDGVVYVRDLSSRTHTIVNGQAVREAELAHGDKLQVGTFTFKISNRASLRSRPIAIPPAAAIEVDGAEFPIPFDQRTLLIGRRPTCDIPLVEESVSTIHAILFTVGKQRFIRDLGSRTGTFVNGSPVHQVELNFGDQIRVGDTSMRYEAHMTSGASLDELEHLVGTAALDEAPPIHPVETESHPHAIPASAESFDEAASDRIPVESEEDLIPLAQDEPIAFAEEEPTAIPAIPAPPQWETEEPVAEQAEAVAPIASEVPAAAAEISSVDELDWADEASIEIAPHAPAAEAPAPAPALEAAIETNEDGLDFADEISEVIPAAETLAADDDHEEAAAVVDSGPVDIATEELLEAAPLAAAEPSLAEDEAADAAEAIATPKALRPEDTNFNFPKHDAEESAPDPVDLDFVPEAEHPAGLGGLDFSERAESPPPSHPAHAPGDLPELDLSGLTLDPPADGSSADMGLDFADDASGAAATAGPLLNLGATPPAPPAFGSFDLTDAPAAPSRGERRPTVRKEKSAKKEKKTWWTRKRKSQEEAEPVSESIEERAAEEPLDAQIERALSGSFGSEGTEEAALDAIEPFAPSATPEPVEKGLNDSLDFSASGVPETAHDSFAGLDFSAVAAGSGLDFGGELDSVDPPTHAASVLPPQTAPAVEAELVAEEPEPAPEAPVEAESATESEREVADVIESTEPTLESALDLEEDLAIAPGNNGPAAPSAPSLASDITQITEPASLSDTAFGRAVSDFSGSSLDPIVEAPITNEEAVTPVAEEESLPAIEAADASVPADADLSFEQLLDEELGGETPVEQAEWAAPGETVSRISEPAPTENLEPETEKPVFDLGGWNPVPAASIAPPAPVQEFRPEPQAEAVEEEVEVEPDLAFAPDALTEASEEEELPSLERAEDPAAAAASDANVVVHQVTEEADEDFEALSEFGTGEVAAQTVEAEAEEEAPEFEAISEEPERLDAKAAVEVPSHVPSGSVSPSVPEDPGHPMISDLTSPTEDMIPAVAADPADAGHLGASEAIDFDLDLEEVPSLADAAAKDLVSEEPAEESLSETFDNAIGRDEPESEEALPQLTSHAPEESETLELTSEIVDEAEAADSGLEFEEARGESEPELTAVDASEPALAEQDVPAAEPVAAEGTPESDPPADENVAGHLPSDPFFGLGRDSGSFLGGLPLSLPPMAAAAAAPQAAAPSAPAALRQGQQQQRRPAGLPAFGSVPIGQVRRPGQPARPAAQAPAPTPAQDDVDPIDFSDSAAGAAPVKPRQPAPPPAARNIPPRVQAPGRPGNSMFDLGLGDVAGGAVEIPPLAGISRPQAGTLTTAFDGLAFPSMGQADVFSQLGPANDPVFGAAGKKSAAELDAEVDQALQDETDGDENDDDDSDGDGGLTNDAGGGHAGNGEADHDAPPAALPGRADSKREKDRRPPGYTPPAQDPSRPQAAPAQPPKKRRWGVRFLLPMMLLCGAIAAAAIYFLMPLVAPRSGTVTGVLEFDRLKDLVPADRTKFENDQKTLLHDPAVFSSATEFIRMHAETENMKPGFLGGTNVADVTAADKIRDSLKVPDGTGQLVLTVDRSTDPMGDKVRMRGLLQELYLRNKSLQDKLGTNQRTYETIEAERKDAVARIGLLTERIPKDRERAGPIAQKEKLEDLNLATKQLSDAWDQASKAVHDIQIDVDAAAAGTDVADGTFNAAATPAVSPAEDPQLIQMSKQLQALSAKLAVEKDAQTAQAAKATAAINNALKKFQSEIGDAQKTMNGDSELSTYLASAQRMQKTMSDMYDRLDRQQASDRAQLNNLKKRLLDKAEAKLNEAWSNDTELKQLQETLSLKEHHRNAAVGSGLAAEAKKLDADIAQLNGRIQARRDLLGTGFAYDAEVKELQKFIDQRLAEMESQRAVDQQQMAELFASLKKDAPSVEKLPAEQQKLAEALEKRSAELDAARAQYAKVAASMTTAGSTPQNSALEQQLTQMQASIDARKRQLADAAAQSLTQKQKQERLARLERRKAELAEAKVTETRAFEAHKAKDKEYRDFQQSLAEAEIASKQLESDIQEKTDLDKKIPSLTEEASLAKADLAKAIVPMPVRDSSVTVSIEPDTRPVFASIAFVFVVVIFSTIMFVVSHSAHESIPLATAAAMHAPADDETVNGTADSGEVAGEFTPDPFNPALRRNKPGRKIDAASQGDEHPLPV